MRIRRAEQRLDLVHPVKGRPDAQSAPHVAGFATHMQSLNRWTVFLLQNGFRFGNEQSPHPAEEPALWESLRVARDLIHQQGSSRPYWTESDADAERWFAEGRVSMMMTSYFGISRLLQTKLEYGIAMLPSLRTNATLLLVTGLAMLEETKVPDAAQSFNRFMCGRDVQLAIRRGSTALPTHPEALSLQRDLPGNRPFREPPLASLWDSCKDYTELNLGTGVLEAIREELKAYWSKLEDEAEAGVRLESLWAKQPD